MRQLPDGVRRAFRLTVARPPIEVEVDDEIAFHLEMRVAELVARGMDPEAARAEAERRFGDTRQWSRAMSTLDREHAAEQRRAEWLGDLRHDLRYGVRTLLRMPLFSLLAVLTLALGIGANAAVFGVVKSVLLDALPYTDADRIVRVFGRWSDGSNDQGPLSAGTVQTVRERQRSFERIAAFEGLPREAVFAGTDAPRVVKVAWTEPDLFRTLGVAPARGRALRDDDAAADTAYNVVLTHAAWQQLVGGDPAIVGNVVRVNGISRTVVGILPRDFVGPLGDVDFYFPLSLRGALRDPARAFGRQYLGLVARLKEGATLEGGRRELAAIAADLAREQPDNNFDVTLATVPVREAMVGDTRAPLLVLMASAALVLLITCANLAGALLSRTLSRRKEFAVRVALGAGRGRLVRQLLTESSVLTLVGGAAGVGLGVLGLHLVRGFALQALPPYAELALDRGALLFTALLALATGIGFGLAPALSVSRSNVQGTLRDEGRGTSEGHRSRQLRGVLVAGQIALCVSLVAGAGLLARSLWALTAAPLGFDPDNVLTASVQLPPGAAYGGGEARARFIQEFEERLRALPGVEAVGTTGELPTRVMNRNGLAVEGAPVGAGEAKPWALYHTVSDDYFRTLGIPLREGRLFGPQERMESPRVVIVNETLARRYWPGESAIGKRIRFGPDDQAPWMEVIGVVGDVANGPTPRESEMATYDSMRQAPWNGPIFLLKTRGDPMALVKPLRQALTALDPTVPLHDATPMRALLAEGLAGRRLPVLLMTAFGALALLLASVGVYALFASMAAAREREFGVRLALGATRAEIAGLVLRQGGVWMAAGLAGGAVGVVVVSRLVRAMLYGVRPFDPLTLGVAVLLLLACATIALLVPVRRATRVDPITALR